MKKIFTLLLIFIGASLPLSAENMSTDDGNAILSLRGRVLSPKVGDFSFFFDQEMRSTDTFGAIKDSRTSLFASYDPVSWFKVSGGYVFLVKEGSDKPSLKHRYILLFKQMFKIGNVGLRVRERFESTCANGRLFGSDDVGEGTNLLRTRLKLNYTIENSKVVPYIYTELYNQINESMLLTRVRSQAGVEISLSKSSKLTTFYQYAHFTNVATSTAPHTLGVLYAYKFSRK